MKTNRSLVVIHLQGSHTTCTIKAFQKIGTDVVALAPYEARKWLAENKALGIVLCGGRSLPEPGRFPHEILKASIPILALGSSMHLVLGWKSEIKSCLGSHEDRDHRSVIHIDETDPLFEDMDHVQSVFHDMLYTTLGLPSGARQIATLRDGIAGFSNLQDHIWGLCFQPGEDQTGVGSKILQNFVNICMRRFEPQGVHETVCET
jgi:GMP synthase-like glutamine amidotransferase